MIRSATIGDAARLTSAPPGRREILPETVRRAVRLRCGQAPPGVTPFGVIREDEGVTVILTRADADRAGPAVPGTLRPGGLHAPGEHPLRHRR
jgi:ACT domain